MDLFKDWLCDDPVRSEPHVTLIVIEVSLKLFRNQNVKTLQVSRLQLAC